MGSSLPLVIRNSGLPEGLNFTIEVVSVENSIEPDTDTCHPDLNGKNSKYEVRGREYYGTDTSKPPGVGFPNEVGVVKNHFSDLNLSKNYMINQ